MARTMAKLTRAEFDALEDDRLEFVLRERLDPQVPWEDADAIPGVLRSLSRGERMLLSTTVLEGEVVNGGFNQFFFNHRGNFAEEAVEGYRLIGAERHAALVAEAMETVLDEMGALRHFWDQRTLDAFRRSYGHTTLPRLDREFWKLDAFDLRAAYLRRHPDEFVEG